MEFGLILIAHKDPLARGYFRLLAERDLQSPPVCEADCFDALLQRAREAPQLGLVLLDFDLPGLVPDIGLRYLASHYPNLRTAVFYSTLRREEVWGLADDGIAALVPKSEPDASMVEILKKLMSGANYVHFSAIEAEVTQVEDPQLSFLGNTLTARQIEVLRLLSEGLTNRGISQMLGIAEGTVKAHVNAGFRTLGVHNRVNAARALRELFGMERT